MAQSLQSLMLDAKTFCLKMQNIQVPICSQYGTLFQSNCSIFQIKSRNHLFHCFVEFFYDISHCVEYGICVVIYANFRLAILSL